MLWVLIRIAYHKNTCCGYSSLQGDSNEYPQHMFFMENYRKLSFSYHQIPSLSVSRYEPGCGACITETLPFLRIPTDFVFVTSYVPHPHLPSWSNMTKSSISGKEERSYMTFRFTEPLNSSLHNHDRTEIINQHV